MERVWLVSDVIKLNNKEDKEVEQKRRKASNLPEQLDISYKMEKNKQRRTKKRQKWECNKRKKVENKMLIGCNTIKEQ